MCTHIYIYVLYLCVYFYCAVCLYNIQYKWNITFYVKDLKTWARVSFLYFQCLFVLCIKLYIPSNVHPIMQQLCISSKQISHKNWECAYFSFPLSLSPSLTLTQDICDERFSCLLCFKDEGQVWHFDFTHRFVRQMVGMHYSELVRYSVS